jgi:outer membrane protein OmpA-like peptidoglycan-associated protein
MKTKHYLGNSFTIEFDFIMANEENCLVVFFPDAEEDEGRHLNFSYFGEISNPYFENALAGVYPGGEENFPNKWHHAAIAYRAGQMKIYVDQHRVLVIPKTGFQPVRFLLGGCTDTQIRNVKIADGGGMNMLGKIITDGKFVSHAIKFDINKSVIKGESMGFLNELAKWLKENAAVKLEIGGHTDSDGDDASNLKLSQARADAVKTQLTSMGVDAARLTAKGYGEAKPLDSNATPEGKANNRRVEFTKM